MLPYSIVLGLMVAYWVFVICTGLDIGTEAFDGALDGAVESALDGAMDAALDGAADAAVDSVADAAVDAATDGAMEGTVEAHNGLFATLLAFLNLGQVPATIIFSLIILKMWLLAALFHLVLQPKLGFLAIPAIVLAIIAGLLILVVSVFLTAYTARPLRKVYAVRIQRGAAHLVGKICTIRSSRVTGTIGQAELVVDNHPLVLMVRNPEANGLAKDHEAVIVGYDESSNTYQVRSIT